MMYRHTLAAAALLLFCECNKPCELVVTHTNDPTKINVAAWIYSRATRPDSFGGANEYLHYVYANYVVTGVEAEIHTWFGHSLCRPNDGRLTSAAVEVTTPTQQHYPGRIVFDREAHTAEVPEWSGQVPDPARMAFGSRIIFTPQEPGMHTIRVDFGTEGVLERHVFVSQSHSWDEVIAELPWKCVTVERTAMGTWVCDNHTMAADGRRHDFPAEVLVSVSGELLYVWGDSGLEVLRETSPLAFVPVASFDAASNRDERHQLLVEKDKVLLVSSRELRLLRLAGDQMIEGGRGPTPVAPRPVDAGVRPWDWDWGVSYTNDAVLLVKNVKGSTGSWGTELCSLDLPAFTAGDCVPSRGHPQAMNSEGAWVGATVHSVVNGRVVATASYPDPAHGPSLYFNLSLGPELNPKPDGGYVAVSQVRRLPQGRPGWNVCGLPKVEGDGGMVYHVYPEEELERSWFTFCDASREYVWVWTAERYKERTYIFRR